MKPLSDLTLRWFDDGTILEAEGRNLVELFLASLGISSDVAVDIMEVLLTARSEDRALTSEEIKAAVEKKRGLSRKKKIKGEAGETKKKKKKKKPDDDGRGLTLRNIQVWLRYYREIKLIDRLGGRYRFTANKTPTKAFSEYTRPIAEQSMDYVERVLEKIEKQYGIKPHK